MSDPGKPAQAAAKANVEAKRATKPPAAPQPAPTPTPGEIKAQAKAEKAKRKAENAKRKAENAKKKAEKAKRAARAKTAKDRKRAAAIEPWVDWVARSWFDDAQKTTTPKTAYNLACHYARQGNPTRALELLEIAARQPELKDFALKDPVLKVLQSGASKDKFFKIVGPKLSSDFWKLAMFSALKTKLIEGGVATPAELVNYESSNDMRWYLTLEKPPYQRLVDLANLIAAATKASEKSGFSNLQVELVSSLIDMGIESPADIPSGWSTRLPAPNSSAKKDPAQKGPAKRTPVKPGKDLAASPFYERVKALREVQVTAMTDAQLLTWIKDVRGWKPKATGAAA